MTPKHHGRIRRPWSVIDWSHCDREIADALGVRPSSVVVARKKYAPPEYRKVPSPIRTRWEAVDWTKPPSVIAKELGVPVGTVSSHKHSLMRRVNITDQAAD